MRHIIPLLLLAAAGTASCRTAGGDPRIDAIIPAVSPARIEADIRALVGFGTRHALSDTLSATRGIGAARRWIKAEFERISAACGGCLKVRYESEVYQGLSRMPDPTNVVSVIAIQRGTGDPDRYVLMSGHFDSRVSDAMNARDSAPGANDDASGTAAVLEAARVLSGQRFSGSIVYAAFAGEESGLLGSQTLARRARAEGWRLEAVLNNDIIGNTRGADGVTDDRMVRVFSDGTPPTETDEQRRRRRFAGGEVDGSSRQLARYVKAVGERYFPDLDVWLIYRLDRFGRGGDHRSFADQGFPAVRLTEGHEDYARQHQDIRTENGITYGDVLEGVNFRYLARVTALNAAALASLAWAPGRPRTVQITGAVQPAATLTWAPPPDSSAVASYRVYWRKTDAATWDHSLDVGRVTSHRFDGLVIDNWFFGVASVGKDGMESVVVFPGGTD